MWKNLDFIRQQTNKEFAEFTSLHGSPPVFESGLLQRASAFY